MPALHPLVNSIALPEFGEVAPIFGFPCRQTSTQFLGDSFPPILVRLLHSFGTGTAL